MAYDPINNPLLCLSIKRGSSTGVSTPGITIPGKALFQYDSADAASTVRGAGYFAGAAKMPGGQAGLDVGAIVIGTVNGVAGYLSTISEVDADTGDVTVVAFSYN